MKGTPKLEIKELTGQELAEINLSLIAQRDNQSKRK